MMTNTSLTQEYILDFLKITSTNSRNSKNNNYSKGFNPNQLLFLDVHTTHTSKDGGDNFNDGRLMECVTHLLNYINPTSKDVYNIDLNNDALEDHGSHSLFSNQDIALLLVPWSIECILSSFKKDGYALSSIHSESENGKMNELVLAWHTLESCLSILLIRQEGKQVDSCSIESIRNTNTNTSNVSIDSTKNTFGSGSYLLSLSQSKLDKLVMASIPVAFLSSAEIKNNSTISLAKAAAKCYCIITTHLYNPTLDFMCQTLLLHILKSQQKQRHIKSQKTSLSNFKEEVEYLQDKVIHSTFDLIYRLQMRNFANPKKIFYLLTTSTVFKTISQFLYLLSKKTHNDSVTPNEVVMRTEKLIIQIWYHGFFHPHYHLDGFRQILSSLEPLHHAGVYKKNKGSCYQQTFFSTLQSLLSPSDEEKSHNDPTYHTTSAKSTEIKNSSRKESMDVEDDDVSISNAESEKQQNKLNDYMAIFNAIPILIEQFIIQMQEWDEIKQQDDTIVVANFASVYKKKSKKKRKLSTDPDHMSIKDSPMSLSSESLKLIFHFWCQVIDPVVFILQKSDITQTQNMSWPLFRAISQSFSLLLKYDVYHVSYQDHKMKSFNYLNFITDKVLETSESLSEFDKSTLSSSHEPNHPQYQLETIRLFQVVLELNHELLHPKLDRIIYFASSFLSLPYHFSSRADAKESTSLMFTSYNDISQTSSTKLICQIVNTYQKLRKLGDLIKIIQGSLGNNNATNKYRVRSYHEDKPGDMMLIIENVEIARSISQAIYDSPQAQVEQIWSILHDSMLRKGETICDSQSNDHHLEKTRLMLEMEENFLVELFILLTKSIRLGNHNAEKLRFLCEKAIETLVATFINSTDNEGELKGLTLEKLAEISENEKRSFSINQGLKICGWLVHLHTKCSFWLNKKSQDYAGMSLLNKNFEGSLSIVTYIVNVAKNLLPEHDSNYVLCGGKFARKNIAFILSSIQHLSCQRIQQLHSMIYQQEQTERTRRNEESQQKMITSNEMIQEANLLVDFVIHAAVTRNTFCHQGDIQSVGCQLGRQVTTGWKMICQTLVSWTPYSKPNQIRSFLKWFFSILAFSVTSLKPFESYFLPVLNESIETSVLEDEIQIAQTLLRDASFYEIPEVSECLIPIGLSALYELLSHGFCMPSDSSNNKIEIKYKTNTIPILSPKSTYSQLKPMSIDVVLDIIYKGELLVDDAAVSTVAFIPQYLEQALHLLMILNSLPHDSLFQEDLTKVCDMYIQTHIFFLKAFHLLSKSEITPGDLFIKLMCCSKSMLSKALAHGTTHPDWSTNYDSGLIRLILEMELFSTQFLMDKIIHRSSEYRELVGSTNGKVVKQLVSFCVNMTEMDMSCFFAFREFLMHISNPDTKQSGRFLSFSETNFIRSSIQAMIYMNDCGLRKFHLKQNTDGLRVRDICVETMGPIKDNILKCLVRKIRERLCKQQPPNDETCEAVLLYADIMKFFSSFQKKTDTSIFLKFECSEILATKEIIAYTDFCAQGYYESDKDSQKRISIFFYFLCSLVCFSDSIPDPLLFSSMNTLAMKMVKFQHERLNARLDPLLKCSLLGFLSNSTEEHLSSLCKNLFEDLGSEKDTCFVPSKIASTLYCFNLMVVVAKGQSQKTALANYIRPFLNLSLDLQLFIRFSFENDDILNDQDAITAQRFIVSIITKKDLLTLNIGEISLILSRLNILFSFPKKNHKISLTFFLSCCDVVIALFKHYPKQLYGSSSVLTSVLRSLLYHLMAETTVEKESSEGKYQRFSRICELLISHKEVYKKHVIGLILDFVGQMKTTLSNWRKELLLPSIYLLLDMISVYEQDELNAMMDPMAKMMFRSVHQSYLKVHQYKGQF